MDLADWLLQIEKVAVLTNCREYELATANFTCTPYKMQKRLRSDFSWQEIKKEFRRSIFPVQCQKYMLLVITQETVTS